MDSYCKINGNGYGNEVCIEFGYINSKKIKKNPQFSLWVRVAEAERFELSGPLLRGLPDFESGPLWPLRYTSGYISLHLISEIGENSRREQTYKIVFAPSETLIKQGVWERKFQNHREISSHASSTTWVLLRIFKCDIYFIIHISFCQEKASLYF